MTTQVDDEINANRAPLQHVVMRGVRLKEPRCKCLSCKGRTVKFSHKRFVEDMDFFAAKGLMTRNDIADPIREFDEYHGESA